MRELSEIRKDIDELDRELLKLFLKRQALSQEVAQYKQSHGLEIFDEAREQEKLAALDSYPQISKEFMLTLMNFSKQAQSNYLKS